MLHINKIKDADPYFVVEPITRAIKNVSSSKTTLIQHDHNSEQFTFELPRYIEGHDMMECNLVEIHYINESTKGRYIVNDLTVIEDDENRLKFTWLLTNNASSNVGALRFGVRFACLDDDGEIEYVWNTAPYNGITVSTGIYNVDVIEEEYPDVIAELFARIDRIVVSGGGVAKEEVMEMLTSKEDTIHKLDSIFVVATGRDSDNYTDEQYLGAKITMALLQESEHRSNKVSSIPNNLNEENYPTTGAVFDCVKTESDSIKRYVSSYLTSQYYDRTQVDTMIGNIETALENIIAKYELGGDAS